MESVAYTIIGLIIMALLVGLVWFIFTFPVIFLGAFLILIILAFAHNIGESLFD